MSTSTNPTVERRRSARLKANFPIEFRVSVESRLGGGVAQDIAADGVCFTTPRFIPKDARLLLTLQPNPSAEPIHAPAKVVWAQKLGYGDLYRLGVAFSNRITNDIYRLVDNTF